MAATVNELNGCALDDDYKDDEAEYLSGPMPYGYGAFGLRDYAGPE